MTKIESNINIESVAVIVKLKDGRHYQVAINDGNTNYLLDCIAKLDKNSRINLMNTELTTIKLQ